MSVIFVAALVMIVGVFASLVGYFMAWQGSRSIRQIIARPTVPIATLREGATEIVGVISCDAPVQNGDRRLAIVEASITYQAGSGGEKKVRLLAPGLTVRDATGSCPLLTDHLTLSGHRHTWVLSPDEVPRHLPLYAELAQELKSAAPTKAGQEASFHIEEHSLEVGERVLISGHAIADPESMPQDYRRGSSTMAMTGRPDAWMLVSAGPEAASVRRALLPVVLLFLVSSALLFMMGWTGWVTLRLWW